jgi:hypothetical protein
MPSQKALRVSHERQTRPYQAVINLLRDSKADPGQPISLYDTGVPLGYEQAGPYLRASPAGKRWRPECHRRQPAAGKEANGSLRCTIIRCLYTQNESDPDLEQTGLLPSTFLR